MNRIGIYLQNAFGLILVTFLIVLSPQQMFAQGDDSQSYSMIHIVRSSTFLGSECRTDITFPNQRAFNLSHSSIVDYKVYSEGEVTIMVEVNCPGSQSSSPTASTRQAALQVKHGGEYYLLFHMGFEVVQKADAQKHLDKARNTIKLEEDIDSPIIKSSQQAANKGKGQGTCFPISSNGYLVTNYHCVENATEVTVKGVDGDFTTKYGADIVATDKSNDLALLKIKNKNVIFDKLPYSIRSSGVQQGEKVYAIGYPFAQVMGKEVKLTDGIISSKSGVDGDISKFQISAAVNPGNSGGPLVDEHGNLIGVIYAKSTIAESAGYAIKASYLESFLKNVEGLEFPVFTNTFEDKPITEIIAVWKKFVLIVETN